MSAQSTSPLGFGLYFIDVLACLLFCITLALVGARFGREQTVEVDLPRAPESADGGSDLSSAEIAVREAPAGPEIFLEGEQIPIEELAARLAAALPPSVVVRSEESVLARVIAIAHAAGVHDIQLAYEAQRNPQPTKEAR